MSPPKYSQNDAKKRILSNESGQILKKEPKWPDLVDPKSHQYRVKYGQNFPFLGHFSSNFLVFSPKYSTKISFFWQNQIYTSVSALFSLKNYQKWEIMTIISILPYTDDFFGSIFFILGRFAKMPPPLRF